MTAPKKLFSPQADDIGKFASLSTFGHNREFTYKIVFEMLYICILKHFV